MDKQRQIEELARILIKASCKGSECEKCIYIDSVKEAEECCVCLKALYNAGYRKIPENAVVLTMDEHIAMLKDLAESNAKTYEMAYQKGSKETAEKFAERAKEMFFGVNCIDIDEWNWYLDKIDEIFQELTEGNNAYK